MICDPLNRRKMRLFKRKSSCPQLVRLSFLPPDWGSDVPNLRLSSRFRLSLPSIPCATQEGGGGLLMACADIQSPSKTRKGFPFPRMGRKYIGPRKYPVVNEPPLPFDVDGESRRFDCKCGVHCPEDRWRFRRSSLVTINDDYELVENPAVSPSKSAECLLSDNDMDWRLNKSIFRSVSATALNEECEDESQNCSVQVHETKAYFPLKTLSCEDLSESCCLAANELEQPPQKPKLGTVFEEEACLDELTRKDSSIPGSRPNSQIVAEDTESLASSTHHRSDESGYESDGTKNGEIPEETVTLIVNEEEDKMIADTISTPVNRPTNFNNGAKPVVLQAIRETAVLQNLTEKTPERNLQKFTALLQKLALSSVNTTIRRNNSHANLDKLLEAPTHETPTNNNPKTYDVRSLRTRAPAVLSELVQHNNPSVLEPDKMHHIRSASEERSTSKDVSRLNQFKAWTLDRKFLRNKWKKTPETPPPTPAKRSSIFQSSLYSDTTTTTTPRVPETTAAKEVIVEVKPKCGDLNYQLRLKKSGVKATSLNDVRRRQWLESQLCASTAAPTQVKQRHNSDGASSRKLVQRTEIVNVSLQKDDSGELGLYIRGHHDKDRNVLGYVIADLEEGSPAQRSGVLRKGDELLVINGQQLQGVGLDEAHQLLKTPDKYVHLLVSRKVSRSHQHQTGSDCNQRKLSTPHLQESVKPKPQNRHSHPNTLCQENTKETQKAATETGLCTLPRRPKSSQLTLHTVVFEKGPGKKSLGFSIVGGKDSPKGELGFYVKTVFPNGQAAETEKLKEGDEIFLLNGQLLQGLSHSEALAEFKKIKQGDVVLHIGRRIAIKKNMLVSKSCSELDCLS